MVLDLLPRAATPVGLCFVACNSALAYYLARVVPEQTVYAPGLVHCIGYGILALGTFQVIQFATGWGAAPTGKFNEGALSLQVGLPVGLAWWTMEQPSFLVPLISLERYLRAGNPFHPGVAFLCIFMAHYLQRAYVYPWSSRGRPYPLHAWCSAMLFTAVNGTMQSNWLLYSGRYHAGNLSELCSLRALCGYAIFGFGMFSNIQADQILRNLRKPGETEYKVPRGGLFEYVSGAHFVGEIIEWTGYGVAAWSFAPVVFAAFNWMGIGMRAIATHEWNLRRFGSKYPHNRKRLIPFVW
mmetsp:Transcript_8953/g.24873  ORF Transcript_8953/g.24873 Transcript_8953/m.24873 type:complete len:297 (-) Transcript_8953:143-1033(-)